MKDHVCIGPAPADEPCAQVGDPDFHRRSARECRAYLDQIKRTFGEPPEGCRLKVIQEQHEFGTYREVAVTFDDRDEVSIDWAFLVEARAPRKWDEAARRYLALAELTED